MQTPQNLNGTYNLVDSINPPRIYRNGLRMTPGIDYIQNGHIISPLQIWGFADIVLQEFDAN
jgi:hypothetical protein